MNEIPQKAADALATPAPLTLGQFALLRKLSSPLLDGDASDLAACGAALWLLSLPRAEAARRFAEAPAQGLAYLDSLSPAAYREALKALFDAISAFYDMLPRPEESDAKKNASEMAGSPN